MTSNAWQSTPRMTVAEFLVWAEAQPDGRYELVDGVVVAMAPERIRHNRAKGAVYDALRAGIAHAQIPCEVFMDGLGVSVDDGYFRIPDATVQCGVDADPDSLFVKPIIVVEIISPSSQKSDTGIKFVEYLSRPGVRHYLIIDPELRFAIHHARDEMGDIHTRIVRSGPITFTPPGFSITCEDLFVET